jgi:heptaprenyl diphosphate synthase
MLSGAPDDVVELLTRWGERIGVAFQLADDLLDVAAETVESGKVPGTDLREHVPTLPVLLLRRGDTGPDTDLVAALEGDLTEDAVLSDVLARLRAHPVMAQAADVAAAWAGDAKSTLTSLPDGPARHALESLSDYVVTRPG